MTGQESYASHLEQAYLAVERSHGTDLVEEQIRHLRNAFAYYRRAASAAPNDATRLRHRDNARMVDRWLARLERRPATGLGALLCAIADAAELALELHGHTRAEVSRRIEDELYHLGAGFVNVRGGSQLSGGRAERVTFVEPQGPGFNTILVVQDDGTFAVEGGA